MGWPPARTTCCGHMAGKLLATRIPFQGWGGCGAFQRRSPTGGCAYGMPLYERTLVPLPASNPESIFTSVSSPEPATRDAVQRTNEVSSFIAPFIALFITIDDTVLACEHEITTRGCGVFSVCGRSFGPVRDYASKN